MDDLDQLGEIYAQGFNCSQVLLKMGLELQGKDNPDLVRTVQSLAGGLGYSGDVCGALSGGACLLGLYAGKGLPEEEQDPRLDFMVTDLVRWFKQEYGQRYGGIHCEDITRDAGKNTPSCCPQIVAATYQQVKEILVENGFDLGGSDR
jgi:C_GCAxxG_C_C family probable redox protein